MNKNDDRSITPSQGGGVFNSVANRIKLIIRLMADRRISPWLKIIPLGSLIYMIVPDIAPGPIDDAAALWLASVLFVELCPEDVVAEHQKAIERIEERQVQDSSADNYKEEDIIDAEYWEK